MRRRFTTGKQRAEAELLANQVLERKYYRSWLSRVEKEFRLIFFIQVAISLAGFFVAPFYDTEIVKEYIYEPRSIRGGSKIYYAEIRTESGQNIQMASVRFRTANISPGDTVRIVRNLLNKVEGVKHMLSGETYFVTAKWAWCFVWFFSLLTGIVSVTFKQPRDLDKRGRIAVFLFVLTVLYLVL